MSAEAILEAEASDVFEDAALESLDEMGLDQPEDPEQEDEEFLALAEWDGEMEDAEELEDFEFLEQEDGDFELLEGDLFLGKVFRFAKRAVKRVGRFVSRGVKWIAKRAGPLLKVLAPVAGKILGGVVGGPAGAMIGGALASAVTREAEGETEAEAEAGLDESDFEFGEAGGDEQAYEAMEEYAAEAAEAETVGAANHAIAKMAATAARMFPGNRKIQTALPRVIRGAAALAKTFRANRRTRWAVRTIPVILKRSLTRLARVARITPRAIVEAMAREAAWVLANRARATAALRHHEQVTRRRRVTPRPRPLPRPRPSPRPWPAPSSPTALRPRFRRRRRIVRPRYCVL